MSDRLLDKYTTKPERSATLVVDQRGHAASESAHQSSHTRAHPLDAEEPDEVEDRGCFGYLRGIRDRAVMLELRKRDGSILAIGYAWIDRMEYVPERGITLLGPEHLVQISGSGLNQVAKGLICPSLRLATPPSLYGGLVRHRVAWISETRQTALCSDVDLPVVASIEIRDQR